MNTITATENASSHNGFISTVWGPPLWFVLHCISMNYPPEPSETEKLHYRIWFEGLAHVLPCSACRENFSEALLDSNLYDEERDFVSRTTLTHLITRLHNKVNQHTKNSQRPFGDDEVCAFYNQFRATDCREDTCFSTKRSMVCSLHITETIPSDEGEQRFIVEPVMTRRVHWT
jgi:hypothetical protein